MRSVDKYKCLRRTINEIYYSSTKDAPLSNIAIIRTPIFQWYMVRCGSKNPPPFPPPQKRKEKKKDK